MSLGLARATHAVNYELQIGQFDVGLVGPPYFNEEPFRNDTERLFSYASSANAPISVTLQEYRLEFSSNAISISHWTGAVLSARATMVI